MILSCNVINLTLVKTDYNGDDDYHEIIPENHMQIKEKGF